VSGVGSCGRALRRECCLFRWRSRYHSHNGPAALIMAQEHARTSAEIAPMTDLLSDQFSIRARFAGRQFAERSTGLARTRAADRRGIARRLRSGRSRHDGADS
jgi:hypothetical protein